MKVNTCSVFGHRYEWWYDNHVRVWYAREVDNEGNQVGETIDNAERNMLLVLIGAQAANDASTRERESLRSPRP